MFVVVADVADNVTDWLHTYIHIFISVPHLTPLPPAQVYLYSAPQMISFDEQFEAHNGARRRMVLSGPHLHPEQKTPQLSSACCCFLSDSI